MQTLRPHRDNHDDHQDTAESHLSDAAGGHELTLWTASINDTSYTHPRTYFRIHHLSLLVTRFSFASVLLFEFCLFELKALWNSCLVKWKNAWIWAPKPVYGDNNWTLKGFQITPLWKKGFWIPFSALLILFNIITEWFNPLHRACRDQGQTVVCGWQRPCSCSEGCFEIFGVYMLYKQVSHAG